MQFSEHHTSKTKKAQIPNADNWSYHYNQPTLKYRCCICALSEIGALNAGTRYVWHLSAKLNVSVFNLYYVRIDVSNTYSVDSSIFVAILV